MTLSEILKALKEVLPDSDRQRHFLDGAILEIELAMKVSEE